MKNPQLQRKEKYIFRKGPFVINLLDFFKPKQNNSEKK